jgi:hypothetical protein
MYMLRQIQLKTKYFDVLKCYSVYSTLHVSSILDTHSSTCIIVPNLSFLLFVL